MTHTIEDLMASAVGQRPVDFEQSFDAIMMDRARAAVENRKLEMAKTMFANAVEEEEEVEEDVEQVDERFGGRSSEVGIRNNPPQGSGSTPAPAPAKGTGKSDLMTSLNAVRKAKTPILKVGG